MSEMLAMPEVQAIPMDLQTLGRIGDLSPNMVSYLNGRTSEDGTRVTAFMATIYSVTPKFFEAFPSLPATPGETPVFCMYGKGYTAAAAASSCLDVLLSLGHQKGHRAILESWFLTRQIGSDRSYTLCSKVRHEGQPQDLRQPKTRFAAFQLPRSSPVVPDHVFETLAPNLKRISSSLTTDEFFFTIKT